MPTKLNQNWEIKKVDEVCSEIIDCVNKTAPSIEGPTEYKMLRTTNVRDGWVNTEDVKYVDQPTYKKWIRRGKPKKGDVILTREAPLGEVGMLRSDDIVFLGQRLVMYRADPEKLDNRFLLYSMQDHYMQSQIKSYGSGSTVQHMRVPHCKELKIKLPPLKTQQKIASILSAFDDLIENNTRRIAILEEMARLIYREWFVHYRYPGHENDRLVDSGTELGEVPEGWDISKISDVVDTIGGGTPRRKKDEYWSDGTIEWYTPSDLTAENTMFIDNSGERINELGLKKSSAKIFPPQSVMMTSRATIGVISINTTKASTNQGFITCVPNDRLNKYQIYFWLKEIMPLIEQYASGATYKEINKTTFRKIETVVPALEISKRFYELVDPIGRQIQTLQRQTQKLKETRDLLLPKLISGKVEV